MRIGLPTAGGSLLRGDAIDAFKWEREFDFHALELKFVDLEDCECEWIEGFFILYIKTRERLEKPKTSVFARSNEENPSSFTAFVFSNSLTLLVDSPQVTRRKKVVWREVEEFEMVYSNES